MHEIYERLKKICKDNGTNITSLCKEVTGSNGNSSTWKTGNIRTDYLIKISQKFNVSVDYILCKTDDPAPPAAPPQSDASNSEKKIDKDYIKNFTGLDFSDSNFLYIMGKNGVNMKIPIPLEKLERFKKLLEAGMPELLDDYSDL